MRLVGKASWARASSAPCPAWALVCPCKPGPGPAEPRTRPTAGPAFCSAHSAASPFTGRGPSFRPHQCHPLREAFLKPHFIFVWEMSLKRRKGRRVERGSHAPSPAAGPGQEPHSQSWTATGSRPHSRVSVPGSRGAPGPVSGSDGSAPRPPSCPGWIPCLGASVPAPSPLPSVCLRPRAPSPGSEPMCPPRLLWPVCGLGSRAQSPPPGPPPAPHSRSHPHPPALAPSTASSALAHVHSVSGLAIVRLARTVPSAEMPLAATGRADRRGLGQCGRPPGRRPVSSCSATDGKVPL